MIGTISIFNESIFDLDNPEENKALYQLANKVHTTTQRNVIQQQLLFHEGDEFSERILEESERILRSNRYIQDATIKAERQENGVVDVSVHTADVWTLMPKISFSRSGGENNAGIGIKEMNLLGSGIEVPAAGSGAPSAKDRCGSKAITSMNRNSRVRQVSAKCPKRIVLSGVVISPSRSALCGSCSGPLRIYADLRC